MHATDDALVHDRGQDFGAGIWVVDPAFMLDLVHEHIGQGDTTPAREDAYFAGARIDDDESATRPPRTDSAERKREPGTPTPPAATSASGTTSAPA